MRRGLLLVCANWGSRGGLQNELHELVTVLAARQRVIVLTWRPLARPSLVREETGVQVATLPCLLPWSRDLLMPAAALNTLVSVGTGALAAVVLRRSWSTAFAVGLHPEAVVAVLAAGRRRRVVARTWLVGPLGNVHRLQRSPLAPLLRRTLARVDTIVAETEEAGRELRSLGLRAERVRVLPCGVDLERFRPRPEGSVQARPPTVVFAGRLDLRQKLLDVLVEGWREAQLAGWELVIAGTGRDGNRVRRLVAGVPGVRLVGWRDPAPLLAGAEAFVLPTTAETSALAMLEGMASGLPGLVSDLPGFAERSPAGVSLVANEPRAWAQALRELAASEPAERRRAGRRARTWAEREASGARLTAAWAELLEKA